MVGVKKLKVDWVEVGRTHALVAFKKGCPLAIADRVPPLERVEHEADGDMLRSVYGLVSPADFSAYRNAYRSTLHSENLKFEAAIRGAQKRAGLSGGVAL